MCKSAEEGGQRCAAHTRPAFEAVIAELDANKMARPKVRNRRMVDKDGNEITTLQAIINYASTAEGTKKVPEVIARYQAERDMQTVAWMRTGIKNGVVKAEVAKEVAAVVRKEKASIKRRDSNSMSPRRPNPRLKFEDSLAGQYPEVAERWHPTRNTHHDDPSQQVAPHQVEPGKNCEIWFRCPKGHSYSARLNNVTNPIKRGEGVPECPECKGRRIRQEGLNAVRADLDPILAALGNDPDAWESLSPATRHAIMAKMGMLNGNDDGFRQATALSMIHGELTLREVVEAKNAEMIRNRVNENLRADDDDADKEIDLSQGIEEAAGGNALPNGDTTESRVDRIMASAGTIGLLPDDPDLAEQIVGEGVEGLWNEVNDNPAAAEAIAARVERGLTTPGGGMIAERFLTELRAAQNMPLPDGYSGTKRLGTGEVVEIEPTLGQKRFALMVQERRTVTNLSGTGAGKTIAAVLAARQVDAQETLVMCPAGSVARQWQKEFKERFPDTDVRFGLPKPGEDLEETHDGRPRVWVINYDKLSANSAEAAKALAPLAGRLDCAILDEAHKIKSIDEKNQSQRRDVLDKFMDKARDTNPDLAVVGATATPIITTLEEGKALLRAVHGPEYVKGFGTKPTKRNAAIAYQMMRKSGVRWRPAYSTTLERIPTKVDISSNLGQVLDRVDKLAAEDRNKGKKITGNTPSQMERALLPEKMPAILNEVRSANGPVVVYSHYVEGMVDPIVKRMQDEGIPAARYTGKESDKDRADLIRRFQQGEIKVIVGSRPIATGVDGLQQVCDTMIVASGTDTAADDDQLVGRLQRTGQTRNVKIKYIVTEAKVEGQPWSYDQKRADRRNFRRGLSDAAVDGIMADGRLGSAEKATTAAVSALRNLLGKGEAPAATQAA